MIEEIVTEQASGSFHLQLPLLLLHVMHSVTGRSIGDNMTVECG